MPGILPMKIIKVGGVETQQSRIAQACDRCRCKKIRCDGNRPCCTQCANVGFECKTSDKLSRRAFPRGYTESLEERVRSLETELRELKDVLDDRDEKMEMLSKMHASRPSPPRRLDSKSAQNPSIDEDVVQIRVPATQNDVEYVHTGASSSRHCLNILDAKLKQQGTSTFNVENASLGRTRIALPYAFKTVAITMKPPPRMWSDRCVHIFFQEWAPIFPVLSKSSFLRLYQQYSTDPQRIMQYEDIAQLNLVFAIAGFSNPTADPSLVAECKQQWSASLDAICKDTSLVTLQCLTLAIIYCSLTGDHVLLQHYKALAVGMAHCLGVHHEHANDRLDSGVKEMRRRIFWVLYAVDSFSAAAAGLPMLLQDKTIKCAFPTMIDRVPSPDESGQACATDPSHPLATAIAFFKLSRILCRTLDASYVPTTLATLSKRKLSDLEADLDKWSTELPTDLKLTFVNDKPSTGVTGSRSAILSIAQSYVHKLIRRPLMTTDEPHLAASAALTVAEASKHIVQIIQLLDERDMSFSLCLNKNELLTSCGLAFLCEAVDLKQEGRLVQDHQRMLAIAIDYISRDDPDTAIQLARIAALSAGFNNHAGVVDRTGSAPAKPIGIDTTVGWSSAKKAPSKHSSTFHGHQQLTAHHPKHKRMTLPGRLPAGSDGRAQHARRSLGTINTSLLDMKHEHAHPELSARRWLQKDHTTQALRPPNLDYLSLNPSPNQSQLQSPLMSRSQSQSQNQHPQHVLTPPTSDCTSAGLSPAEWDLLIGKIGGAPVVDMLEGGGLMSSPPPAGVKFESTTSSATSPTYYAWSPDSWGLGSLSFSADSMSSCDDLSGAGAAEIPVVSMASSQAPIPASLDACLQFGTHVDMLED